MAKKKKSKDSMTATFKSLPIGAEMIMDCKSPQHCESIRSIVYRIPLAYIDQRGKKYSCKINYIKSQVTIKVTTAKQLYK